MDDFGAAATGFAVGVLKVVTGLFLFELLAKLFWIGVETVIDIRRDGSTTLFGFELSKPDEISNPHKN